MIESKYVVTIQEDEDERTLDVRDIRNIVIQAISEVNERAAQYGITLAGITVNVEAVA